MNKSQKKLNLLTLLLPIIFLVILLSGFCNPVYAKTQDENIVASDIVQYDSSPISYSTTQPITEDLNYSTPETKDTYVDDNSNEFQNDSTTSTRSSMMVYGTLQWQDDWGNLHPLQFTKVEIMDKNGGFLGIGNKKLATVYTNQSGYYSVTVQDTGSYNPFIKVYAEGENTIVKDSDNDEYVIEIYPEEEVTMITQISDVITMGQLSGQAFQISQAVITASRFVNVVNGDYVDDVTVIYPHNDENAGCYYNPDNNRIYIRESRDTDYVVDSNTRLHPYASWDVVMHEYFHHVQSELNITDSPAGTHIVDWNIYEHYLSHYNGGNSANDCVKNGQITCAYKNFNNKDEANEVKEKAIKLTYAESMASVLGAIAQKYAIDNGWISNIYYVGNASYTSYNGAYIDYHNNNAKYGEVGEISVAGVLWNIYDNFGNSYDYVSLGYQAFWDLMLQQVNNHNIYTLSDFIDAFYSTYPSQTDNLGQILNHFNVAPTLGSVANMFFIGAPTFNWAPGGSDSTVYQNNRFDIKFFDSTKTPILTITNVTTSYYTLTSTDWITILDASGDHFYWVVGARQVDTYSQLVTGTYYCSMSKVFKPTPLDLSDLSSNECIMVPPTAVGEFYWFKYTAPASGTYTFFTTGNVDTYGALFSACNYGLSVENILAYDDNSGDNTNFKITYQLSYHQTVYLRVRVLGTPIGYYYLYAWSGGGARSNMEPNTLSTKIIGRLDPVEMKIIYFEETPYIEQK